MVIVRIVVLLLFCLGCGSNMDYVLKKAEKIEKAGEFLTINTLDSNGDPLVLQKGIAKVTLLIFSGQYCFSCIQETEHFIASLNDPAVAPSKINILTLLVGGQVLDADDFKFFNGVPWPVGIDPDQALVKKYCGTILTPCLVIQDPVRGIIKTHVGVMPLEELKSYTGEWE